MDNDYVSREAMHMANRYEWDGVCGDYDGHRIFIDNENMIDSIPAADVRPVAHGKWVHGREVGREYLGNCLVGIFYDRWTCSECGYIVDDHAYSGINYKFCPNCGADMMEV